MMILITYDVMTGNREGERRLRKIAKYLESYGQRVQNSVFELSVTPAQYTMIRNAIENIICAEEDSVMIYHLGKNWTRRVERLGKDETYNPEKGLLIL